MSEILVTYYPEREGREAGYTFYPGWIKCDGKKTEGGDWDITDPLNVYNPDILTLSPGENSFTQDQIDVILAHGGFTDKVKKRIIEIEETGAETKAAETEQPKKDDKHANLKK